LLTRLKLSTQRAGLLENHSSNIRLDIECKGANTMQECNCFGRQRLQTSVSFGIAGPLKNRSKYHLTETMLEYYRRIKLTQINTIFYSGLQIIARFPIPGKLARVAAAEDALDQHSPNMGGCHIPAVIAGARQVHPFLVGESR